MCLAEESIGKITLYSHLSLFVFGKDVIVGTFINFVKACTRFEIGRKKEGTRHGNIKLRVQKKSQ